MQTLNFSRCSRFFHPSLKAWLVSCRRPIPCGATRRKIAPVDRSGHTGIGPQARRKHPDRDIMASGARRLLWICSLDFTRLSIPSCAYETTLSKRSVLRVVSHVHRGHFPSIFGLMCASLTCGSPLTIVRLWIPATLPLFSPAAPQRGSSGFSQIVKLTRMLFLFPPSPLSTVACELTVQSADLIASSEDASIFFLVEGQRGQTAPRVLALETYNNANLLVGFFRYSSHSHQKACSTQLFSQVCGLSV